MATYRLTRPSGPLGKTWAPPPPTQGLNKQPRARHTTPQDIDRCHFIRERGILRGDHFEIAGYAARIASGGKVERLLSRLHCCSLDASLLLENPQGCEAVLNLLEPSQYGFSIRRDRKVVTRPGLIGDCAPTAHIKKRYHSRRAR